MKVAVIMDRVYPYFKGGAEKRMWDIAKLLTKKGYEFHFYCGLWPKMKKNEVIDGIYLHGIYKVGQFYKNGKKSIKESIIYSIKLFPVLLKADFDIIDCDQFPLIHIFTVKLVSMLRKKKLILTWSEVWDKYWFEYLGWKGLFGYLTEKIVTRLPDKLISISPHTTKRLVNLTGINPRMIKTIPVGIDIEGIKRIKPSKSKSDVIFAGRLLSHKNVDMLIKAVALIKSKIPCLAGRQASSKIKCLIIGDGPEKRKLGSLVKSLKLSLNVKFTGFIESHNKMLSLVKSSRVFVLPSTREGFGLVVIEANACKIPVVTIDHPDNAAKDLVYDDRNGYLCDLNERNLADTIQKAIKESKKMRLLCEAIARRYDWKNSIRKIEEVYIN